MGTGIIAFFRAAAWLTSVRVRGYSLIVGIASLVLVAAAYVEAMGPTGSDFLAFWGAGHVTAAGDPASAYDLTVQERVQTGTGSGGWFAFVNPPPFLFAATPFGALPFPVAWIAWVSVTFGLWAWASIRAFPRLWPLVLAYPGALVAATHAQTGLLTGALLVFAATHVDRRPLAAGAAVGAMVIKPHLAVLLPFWLAMGRRWRVFGAAAVTVAVLALASWQVFGTATMEGYVTSWRASALLIEGVNPDFLLRMTAFYAQARLFLADPLPAIVAGTSLALALAAALAIWRWSGGDAMGSAAMLLASAALAPPYLFNYDLPFLIVPTLWLVSQGLERGFRPYEKLGLVALWFAPFATRALAFPLGVNLMPLAVLALMALVWTRAGVNGGDGNPTATPGV